MSIGNGPLIVSTFVLCSLITYFSLCSRNFFSLHPMFMSFGFLLFMLNGINVLSERAFGVLKSRSEKIKAHWLLESLSVLFIFIGFLGIYANKILDGKPHFTTWHGFLGAVTVFYSVFQLFMGLLLHFNYNLWRSLLAYSNGRFFHAASGVVLSCLLSLTVMLGLCTNWFKSYAVLYFNSFSPLVLYLCMIIVTLSTFKVFLQVITKYCKCFKIKLFSSQKDAQR
ncbi:hypothetical protein MS3_00010369 [Schistosoma haematobium]|uniref:ascorbate ferrireductase (transmembrane) n=1 Tax=Schistosoma haematobium TaxID=6185 RepID=A0A922LPD6_SCHHA|nr:hypothetical protein MS3_00010369 [Schistosoma haematobium]KAH9590903.1 hypothetical protein MS3_00010369 [Schistosoma haematobium]